MFKGRQKQYDIPDVTAMKLGIRYLFLYYRRPNLVQNGICELHIKRNFGRRLFRGNNMQTEGF